MRSIRYFSAGAAVLAVLLTGCANHLEDVTKESPENARTVQSLQYVVKMDQEVPASSSFTVTLERIENAQITVYQVRKVYSLTTPYEGWRESYEFLAGLGLFPVAVVSNVLSVFTFGMFPFSWSTEVTKYSFDGMNPCMNFESSSRIEEIPVKVERTQVDSHTETRRIPAADEELLIKFGPESWRVRTNQAGQAEIVLLSTDPARSRDVYARHLDIFLASRNLKCRSVPISRRLLQRLSGARQAMLKYYSAPGGAELAQCVRKLESLSFEALALKLEEDELTRNPKFRNAFEQAVK